MSTANFTNINFRTSKSEAVSLLFAKVPNHCVDAEEVARRTAGYSAAEIEILCR